MTEGWIDTEALNEHGATLATFGEELLKEEDLSYDFVVGNLGALIKVARVCGLEADENNIIGLVNQALSIVYYAYENL